MELKSSFKSLEVLELEEINGGFFGFGSLVHMGSGNIINVTVPTNVTVPVNVITTVPTNVTVPTNITVTVPTNVDVCTMLHHFKLF